MNRVHRVRLAIGDICGFDFIRAKECEQNHIVLKPALGAKHRMIRVSQLVEDRHGCQRPARLASEDGARACLQKNDAGNNDVDHSIETVIVNREPWILKTK